MKVNIIHHQKTGLRPNFQNDLLPVVEAMAPETDFFVVFHVYNSLKPMDKILIKVGIIFWGFTAQTDHLFKVFFHLSKTMAIVTKSRT